MYIYVYAAEIKARAAQAIYAPPAMHIRCLLQDGSGQKSAKNVSEGLYQEPVTSNHHTIPN